MHAPHALMLFAAGKGTRMGQLTLRRPKPLIEVAGKPLIDHALELASSANLDTVVVNTHYLSEQVVAHLAPSSVVLSHEPVLLETGGGLRHALPLLGPDPVFSLNSDAVWTGANPLATLRAAWDPERMDALLLLVPRHRALGHLGPGDFRFDGGTRLVRGPDFVYTGAQILRTESLADVDREVFSLNEVWTAMQARGRLCGTLHPGGWCDVGHPGAIAIAESMLAGDV